MRTGALRVQHRQRHAQVDHCLLANALKLRQGGLHRYDSHDGHKPEDFLTVYDERTVYPTAQFSHQRAHRELDRCTCTNCRIPRKRSGAIGVAGTGEQGWHFDRNGGDVWSTSNAGSGYADKSHKNKTERGIAFKQKNLDEDGSVYGFRCVWCTECRAS